jgi:type II secretory pathway component PulF
VSQASQPGPSISLDQLIALSDEVAALVRAGVPLERGLVELAEDLPGRLGKVAASLGQRLEAGESLSAVMSSQGVGLPPEYCAVLEAGLRSGHLAVAVEGIASSMRRVADYRRLVGAALLYPLIVMCVAYVLFVFIATSWTPKMIAVLEQLDVHANVLWRNVAMLGFNAPLWAPWLPLIALVALAVWWYRSGRATSGGAGTWLDGIPTLGHMRRAGRLATFADVLALLVEHQVPLDEAVVLSAEASGDGKLLTAARELARRIESGQSAAAPSQPPAGFPPLLGWMIVNARHQTDLQAALKQTAAAYRDRALRMADWLTVYLPIWLTVVVGGSTVALLAVLILGPWFNVLYQLSY